MCLCHVCYTYDKKTKYDYPPFIKTPLLILFLVPPAYVHVKILGWSEPIPVGCEKNQQEPSAGWAFYLLRAS
jgi:hypothetical protein